VIVPLERAADAESSTGESAALELVEYRPEAGEDVRHVGWLAVAELERPQILELEVRAQGVDEPWTLGMGGARTIGHAASCNAAARRAVGLAVVTASGVASAEDDLGVVVVGDRRDQIIGERCVDELGAALRDKVRAVFVLETPHVSDVVQEHGARPVRIDLTLMRHQIAGLHTERVRDLLHGGDGRGRLKR